MTDMVTDHYNTLIITELNYRVPFSDKTEVFLWDLNDPTAT